MQRIEFIINELIQKDKKVNVQNVVFESLLTTGGTLTNEDEIKKHIEDNFIVYPSGTMYFINSLDRVLINKKALKVINDREYVHSFKKTIVKAINGIEGLKKHFKINKGETFYSINNSIISKY